MYVYVYMYVYVCMCIWVYVGLACMCVYVYVCMSASVYACILVIVVHKDHLGVWSSPHVFVAHNDKLEHMTYMCGTYFSGISLSSRAHHSSPHENNLWFHHSLVLGLMASWQL